MTGLHGGHTPIRSNGGGASLLASERTVAELLQHAGYKTGCFGKWGLGDIGTEGVPWKKGFDEFFGFLHQAHAHFHYPRFLYKNGEEFRLEGNSDTSRKTYANDVIAAQSLDFIRRAADSGSPFFAYLPFTVPHWEPHAPGDSMAEYRGTLGADGPKFQAKDGRLAAQPDVRTAYAAMVSRLDRYVGQVLALLRERKLEDDSIVFFTSDNGGVYRSTGDEFFASYGPLRGQKTNLYEGGLRVPMLVRWPGGGVKAGAVSNLAWSFQDFLATACEVAGIAAPKTDGISVAATLQGRRQKPHEYLYWELPPYLAKTGEFDHAKKPMQPLRQGKWKIVRPKPDAPVELYDFAADPGESKDLVKSAAKVAAKLEALMAAAHTPARQQVSPPHPWWDARS
ncbi:MAG: hypothetical protein FJW31_11025 [Acidobacteria bacterium]|nr:hypothetical protein [Acidobacteriota bacterium]